MTFKSLLPTKLKGLELRNRFVMAAAADNLTSDRGDVSPAQVERLAKLAAGGVGLIISGAITVHATGQSHPASPALDDDARIPGQADLVRRVQAEGAKIAAQLCHSGAWTAAYQNTLGREGIAPSLLPESSVYAKRLAQRGGKYRPATEEDLALVTEAFGRAAGRAQRAGFDAVEIHAAHDSLLCQFLSPATNLRADRWGGPLANRCRLHSQVLASIRQSVGPDFPVIMKLGLADGVPDGLTLAEGLEAARILAGAGADVLEVSLGLQGIDWDDTALKSEKAPEGYYRLGAKALKSLVDAPIILTGGIRSLELAEEVLKAGEADLLGMCRPLIKEPHLINDWLSGDLHRAGCVSCNNCAMALARGKPLACYAKKKKP